MQLSTALRQLESGECPHLCRSQPKLCKQLSAFHNLFLLKLQSAVGWVALSDSPEALHCSGRPEALLKKTKGGGEQAHSSIIKVIIDHFKVISLSKGNQCDLKDPLTWALKSQSNISDLPSFSHKDITQHCVRYSTVRTAARYSDLQLFPSLVFNR